MPASQIRLEPWPELPYHVWRETFTTLHMWLQIVGKIRMAETPWLNHSWHVTLYVTGRGLTTSLIPHGDREFQIDFDFIDHVLRIETSNGEQTRLPLQAQSVADFHAALLSALADLGIEVHIHPLPSELPDPIPFSADRVHAAYDPEYVQRFWRVLVEVDRVFKRFRTAFIGKSSPSHLFWGAADLAVTRFSGRPAPLHPGGVPHLPDAVVREAYSHEVSSAGFWPGGVGLEYPAFYSYAYPEPEGFRSALVRPAAAFYNQDLGEFILPYDVVRTAGDPEATLLEFLQSTYEAAADLGHWDRAALDCAPGTPRVPRPLAPRAEATHHHP